MFQLKFNSLEDMYAKVANWPAPIQSQYWSIVDMTGRPTVDTPSLGLLIYLLERHSGTSEQAFSKEASVVFESATQEELATCYKVFVAGAQFLAQKLSSNVQTR